MKQKISPVYFFIVAFFVMAGFVSMVAVAKNDNATSNSKADTAGGEKSEKNAKVAEKVQIKAVELKEYKKADVANGETNAQVHKAKTAEMIKNLEEVTAQEENTVTVSDTVVIDTASIELKNKAKNKIKEVATEQEISQAQVAEAIEEVENDGVAKKFFFGPDYKNLGQLRSELVQNRNQIRKLTQAIATLAQTGADTTALEAQLVTLTGERERIKTILTTNQETFSLLGWFSRFLNNYETTPINEQEEDDLIEEVQEVVSDDTIDTVVPVDTIAPVETIAPTDTTPTNTETTVTPVQ